MPNNCAICDLPEDQRRAIDRDLTMGRSRAVISKEYGVSANTLRNHANKHLTPQMAKHTEIREKANAINVFKELEQLMTEAKQILKESRDKKHNTLALHCIAQIRGNLTLYSQIQAELYKQNLLAEGISPEELTEFREWQKQKQTKEKQVTDIMLLLPDEYKESWFQINQFLLEHQPISPIGNSSESEVESDSDLEAWEEFEVERGARTAPSTAQDPEIAPVTDQDKAGQKSIVIPEPQDSPSVGENAESSPSTQSETDETMRVRPIAPRPLTYTDRKGRVRTK